MALLEISEAARSLNVKPAALRMAIKKKRISVSGRGLRGVAQFRESELERYRIARMENKSHPGRTGRKRLSQ